MRVSRRSLLTRVFDDGDLLEDWTGPGQLRPPEDPESLIANMSQQEADATDALARGETPWIDPRLARGGKRQAQKASHGRRRKRAR